MNIPINIEKLLEESIIEGSRIEFKEGLVEGLVERLVDGLVENQ